jgi:putative MATE family efflux protein
MKAKDYTTGSLPDRILFFAIPIAASSILQQLFNAADTAVVGRFASSEALAAVGSNSALTAMFVNILVGLSIGSNVEIAQAIGSGERERISHVVHTSVLFAMLSGFLLMLIGIPLARPILTLMGTPENVLEQAVLYLRIYFIGMPFIVLYNFGAAILRAVGDTRRPMYCLAFSGIVNVVLNLLLVIVFHLGVAGVGIATVLSNVISCTLVMFLLCRDQGDIHLSFSRLRIRSDVLHRILVIGGPSSIQGVAFSLSNVCIQSGINSFGSYAVAASSAVGNIEAMDYFLVSSFNQAAMTMIGQNYGARKLDRCRRITRLCILEALAVMAVWESAVFLLQDKILGIFTSDPLVLDFAVEKMWYTVLPHFMICGYELLASSMRGMGRSMVPAIIAVCGTVAFRLLWVFLVFPQFGTFASLLIVYFFSWILTNTVMAIAYFKVVKGLERTSMKTSTD